jgi:hypothetical protein
MIHELRVFHGVPERLPALLEVLRPIRCGCSRNMESSSSGSGP